MVVAPPTPNVPHTSQPRVTRPEAVLAIGLVRARCLRSSIGGFNFSTVENTTFNMPKDMFSWDQLPRIQI
jgi:hypothetical protein